MEQKKIKKLVLNKETISTLNEEGMNQLKGGAYSDACETIYQALLCTAGCNKDTRVTCDCTRGENCTQTCATECEISRCGTCGGGTGLGMCCENATDLCKPGY